MNLYLKTFIYITVFSFIIGVFKDLFTRLQKNNLIYDTSANISKKNDEIELLEMTMKIDKIVDYDYDEEII